jgi:type II secretory pathway component PulK
VISSNRDERGVALVAAVFALAIIGALIASSFFAGWLEQQSGQSTFFAAQAREAAEAGIAESVAGVTAETLEGLAVGAAPLELANTLIGNGVMARSQVTRLTSHIFLIRATGQRHSPDGTVLATRTLGVLIQLMAPPTAEPGSSSAVTPLAQRGWIHLY